MKIDLSGKGVLVTGASRGIGKAIARAMAGAGARVAIHYNQNAEAAEDLAKEIAGGAFCIQGDLADPMACEAIFNVAVEGLGKVDVLVNNAGISIQIPMEASIESWFSGWTQTMAVNLMAAELLARLAVGHFQEHAGGRIINIASRAAFRGDQADYMTYAASKGGMVAMSKSIARAFGKDDIMAFVIAPGFTRTDMAQEFIETYGEEYTTSDLALNRMTEPEDIAPMVVMLASGFADHATGTSIDINAGSYAH